MRGSPAETGGGGGMRLNCGHSYGVKVRAKHRWHVWFAWFPVRVGSKRCRWLEPVKRKGKCYSYGGDVWWVWKYKDIQSAAETGGCG